MSEQQLINGALLGSDYRVYLDKQKEIGKVNDAPEFEEVSLRTGGKAEIKRNYVKSEAISADRQGREHILDSVEYSAELNGESDMQAISHLASAIHGVAEKTETTLSTIVTRADGFFITDETVMEKFNVGDHIWATNFVKTDINRRYRVMGIDSAKDVLLTDPKPAEAAIDGAAGLGGASLVYLSKNKVKNGKKVTPYTIQNRVTDESKTNGLRYQTLFDSVINTMSLEFPEEGMCKFSLGMLAAAQATGDDAFLT